MQGFEPIYNKNSKILILGSFPSVKSREIDFYYGNKNNRFWRVMEEIFNVQLQTVEDKLNCIISHNLALWDICQECEIDGSLDSNIKKVKFAKLEKILPPYSQIHIILCNGRKSYDLTMQYIKQHNIDIEIKYLPSTSPANTRFNIKNWVKELTSI